MVKLIPKYYIYSSLKKLILSKKCSLTWVIIPEIFDGFVVSVFVSWERAWNLPQDDLTAAAGSLLVQSSFAVYVAVVFR